MEQVHRHKLSFPQRNWLLLCILVAIITAVTVYYLRGRSNSNTVDIENASSSTINGMDSAGIPPDSLSH
ncbi:hypothetical protein [Foetidibacter luteolus]|uniref:hypothetical protein n=1 Tax=Foetidibacter luteolus TaxID=2608880 RepID=UPI00129A822B|nr:hypothetical protein [Foetidibacter luteolus]